MILKQKQQHLEEILRKTEKLAIAFSGGVDSTFLLKCAHNVLKDNVLALTVLLRSVPAWEREDARRLAKDIGVRHIELELDELAIEGFSQNPPNRCYICKKAIMGQALKTARQNGFHLLAEGSNTDDANDYRPGALAVKELGLLSPLKDAGLNKREIRELSKQAQLSTWDKPSYACLASRFVYGEEITRQKLKMVEAAEAYLHGLGHANVRVRMHNTMARIELPCGELQALARPHTAKAVSDRLKSLGFSYVALDLAGYRTGSMNDGL